MIASSPSILGLIGRLQAEKRRTQPQPRHRALRKACSIQACSVITLALAGYCTSSKSLPRLEKPWSMWAGPS
eukprot:1160857-Pelagomonas_calceolata.AAC.2